MNSTDLLPQVDGWVKVIAAVLAAIGALLYTSSGFFKELFQYRTRVREIAALTPKPIDTIKGGDIAQWQSMTDLTEAVKENTIAMAALTAAVREETKQEVEARKTRLESVLEGVVHALEAREAERDKRPRR